MAGFENGSGLFWLGIILRTLVHATSDRIILPPSRVFNGVGGVPLILTGWARRELRHGDLTMLSYLSKGWGEPEPKQIERLSLSYSSR